MNGRINLKHNTFNKNHFRRSTYSQINHLWLDSWIYLCHSWNGVKIIFHLQRTKKKAWKCAVVKKRCIQQTHKLNWYWSNQQMGILCSKDKSFILNDTKFGIVKNETRLQRFRSNFYWWILLKWLLLIWKEKEELSVLTKKSKAAGKLRKISSCK